jgi:hypothetical protein
MIVKSPILAIRVDYERIFPGDKPGEPMTATILGVDADDVTRYLTSRLGKINITQVGTVSKVDAIADKALVNIYQQMNTPLGAVEQKPKKKVKTEPVPEVKVEKESKKVEPVVEKRKPGRPPTLNPKLKNESIPINKDDFSSDMAILKHIEKLAEG